MKKLILLLASDSTDSAKTCFRCGETKPLSNYSHRKYTSKDGTVKEYYNKLCKPCRVDEERERVAANYESHIAKRRQYAKDNREHLNAYRLQHKRDNPERTKEIQRKSAEKNLARRRERRAERTATDPDYVLQLRIEGKMARYKRRARLAGVAAAGRTTKAQWKHLLSECGNKCLKCGSKDKKLSMDHVFPLLLGGTSSVGNMQPLCTSCNSSKSSAFIDYRPWTMDIDEIGLTNKCYVQ